jgi:hypothetical protein
MTEKIQSLWPLPGGVLQYADTLYEALRYVNQNDITFEQLIQWRREKYELTGDVAPHPLK